MSVIEATAVAEPRPLRRSVASGTAAALTDLIDYGMLLCDRRAALLFANRAARRELADARALEVRAGVVRCSHGSRGEFEGAVREAAEGRRSRLLAVGEGPDRLAVIAMPSSLGHEAEPAALLMLGTRTPCSRLALAMLATRHRLTFTEHRVLQALLSGRTAREICTDLDVRMTTVRTHLQSLREKFDVRSIDELLILIARVPPVGTL